MRTRLCLPRLARSQWQFGRARVALSGSWLPGRRPSSTLHAGLFSPPRDEDSERRGSAAGAPSPAAERSGGMHARSTTIRGNPTRLEDAVVHMREEILPQLQEMKGF